MIVDTAIGMEKRGGGETIRFASFMFKHILLLVFWSFSFRSSPTRHIVSLLLASLFSFVPGARDDINSSSIRVT